MTDHVPSTDTTTAHDEWSRVLALRTSPAVYEQIRQQAHHAGMRPATYARVLLLRALRDEREQVRQAAA